ncbi:unnamed protein product [Blepharisma stoltei]|uniref:START domain-containing protein n=1 Tax=Blepharisma stoltei TaxID=1481888 RepID=A0AAU9JY12_9CILI|nr:unnamed protein product [Blepharisma stoltei]
MEDSTSSFIGEELRNYIKLKRKRRWVNRFVVLSSGMLYYFKTPASLKPRCVISLVGCQVNNLGVEKREYILDISKPNHYSIKLAFPSQSEYNLWFMRLSSFAEQYKEDPDHVPSSCLHQEERKKMNRENLQLIEQLPIGEIPNLTKQQIEEIVGKKYVLIRSEGSGTYSECAGNKAENRSIAKYGQIGFIAGALIVSLISHFALGNALTGLCFALIVAVYYPHMISSKSASAAQKIQFKTTILINSGAGETLTALHDSPCRSLWEPYLHDCTDGSRMTFTYEVNGIQATQEVTRQFVKDGNIFYVIEKADNTIKNIFKVESKSKYGKMMSFVSHFGYFEENNSIVGNPSLLACLKNYVESNTIYLSNQQVSNQTTDKVDSDSDEEEETKIDDGPGLAITQPIPDEKKEMILQLNNEAVKAMQEAEKLAADSEGWEEIKLKVNTVKGSRRKAAGGLYIVRGEGDINRSAIEVIEYIKDINRKAEYDDMFESGYVIEKLTDEMEIAYQKYKKTGPVSSRDLCLLQRRFDLEGGKIVAIAMSTTHPNCPETKFVRAHLYLGCFVLTPVSPTVTHMVYMINVDIKGSIPKFIINSVQSDQALVVEKIRKNLAA